MASTLETLLTTAAPAYPANSRHHTAQQLTLTTESGEQIRYLARRFLPDPDTLPEVGLHTVRDGERMDQVAARLFGDPELAWRVADGNRALHPAELEEAGTSVRVTRA